MGNHVKIYDNGTFQFDSGNASDAYTEALMQIAKKQGLYSDGSSLEGAGYFYDE